jgi:magnesium transporter
MSPADTKSSPQQVLADFRSLLEKQALVLELERQHPGPRAEITLQLLEKQHQEELKTRINRLHPADIAFVLENLPLDERSRIWRLVNPEHDGAVLLEVTDAVRDTLLADMDRREILEAADHLETDELVELVPELPSEVVPEILGALERPERERVQSALHFPDGSVGALMDTDIISVRTDTSLDAVLRYLRRLGRAPSGPLMVAQRDGTLIGLLHVEDVLTHDGETPVSEVMQRDPVAFHTNDEAEAASLSFERYDLPAAPVVNSHGRPVGVLNAADVHQYLHEQSQQDLLSQAGLREEEDLFAPIRQAARNRWAWLALNLFTAFLATRVIDTFEGAIEKTVALAALMPIVASVGGNTGNQTVALVIRGLALEQLGTHNLWPLVRKEVSIALLNGLVWGGVMAVITWLLYGKWLLALIMLAAMVMNLILASLVGIFVPFGLKLLGRDPVMGSSVLLTALTDGMGFFLFLGLAAAFLG